MSSLSDLNTFIKNEITDGTETVKYGKRNISCSFYVDDDVANGIINFVDVIAVEYGIHNNFLQIMNTHIKRAIDNTSFTADIDSETSSLALVVKFVLEDDILLLVYQAIIKAVSEIKWKDREEDKNKVIQIFTSAVESIQRNRNIYKF